MEKPSEKEQERPGFSEFKTQGTVPRPRGKLVAEPRLVLGPGSYLNPGLRPLRPCDRGGEGVEKGVYGLRK